jgi:hypothetical protein
MPFAWVDQRKHLEIYATETTTRSAPLITKVLGVMHKGLYQDQTSCTIVSKSSCSGSVQYITLTLLGTLCMATLSIHS